MPNCGLPIGLDKPVSACKLTASILLSLTLLVFGVCWFAIPGLPSTLLTGFIQTFLIVHNGDSLAYGFWASVPKSVEIHFSVKLFNVTNAADVVATGAKPVLVEVGPFVYNAVTTKTDVNFFEQDYNFTTAAYFNNVSLTFNPAATKANNPEISLDSKLIVPNIPLIVIDQILDKYPRLKGNILNLVIKHLGETDIFIEKTAEEVLWGYTDPALDYLNKSSIVHKVTGLDIDPVFGLLRGQNNSVNPGRIEVDLGTTDYNRANSILKIDGKEKLDYWDSDYANQITGSDGQQMHPLIQRNENISSYCSDIYRSIWMSYSHDRNLHGVTTFRFKLPPEVFYLPSKFPDNQGFCIDNICPPGSGVLNVSCAQPMNAPVFVSMPHFLHADDVYLDGIEGMNPNPDLHEIYVDVEPVTGFVFAAAKRVQYNFFMKRSNLVKSMNNLPERLFLPTMWYAIEVEVGSHDTMKWKSTIGVVKFCYDYFAIIGLVVGGSFLAIIMAKGSLRCYNRSILEQDEEPLLSTNTESMHVDLDNAEQLRRNSDVNGYVSEPQEHDHENEEEEEEEDHDEAQLD